MVVLAASVCTHGGRPIISRQFKELSKDRVTELLSSFSTLLSDSNKSQQTSVEDQYVRYMYQPLEEFYVVLITNKHSNILQDIDTLHLFSQTITSILRSVDEKEIYENCFELLSAFDEIICLGYKENLSSSQIINFLEMDSHEERIQEIIERNKELEAAEASKKKAAELQFKEMMKKTNPQGYNPMDQYQQQQNFNSQYQQQQQSQTEYSNFVDEPQQQSVSAYNNNHNKRGGMQLGKKLTGFADSQPLLVNTPAPQRNFGEQSQQQAYQQPESTSQVKTKPQIENNGILLTINEKYSAQITREGDINSAEVKGDLQIRVNDPTLAFAQVQLLINKDDDDRIVTQYKTHPNVDKKLFNSSSTIGLKDPTKPFPSNDQSLGVLRWRSAVKDVFMNNSAGLLPIVLTTWVNNNTERGTVALTFEYEVSSSKQIDEVSLSIPVINASLTSSENDNVNVKFTDDGVIINITDLRANNSGTFDILCEQIDDDEEALFPMEISFNESKKLESSEGMLVNVTGVVNPESQQELPFDFYINSTSEGIYIA